MYHQDKRDIKPNVYTINYTTLLVLQTYLNLKTTEQVQKTNKQNEVT